MNDPLKVFVRNVENIFLHVDACVVDEDIHLTDSRFHLFDELRQMVDLSNVKREAMSSLAQEFPGFLEPSRIPTDDNDV